MERRLNLAILSFFLVCGIQFVLADYSIDVSVAQQEAYSVGESLEFSVRLLDDGNILNEEVYVEILSPLDEIVISGNYRSNENIEILIEDDFSGGYWDIRAEYKNRTGKGIFLIREEENLNFEISEGYLIITNDGNSIYREEVEIIIGDEVRPLFLDLGIGESERLKLLAPNGEYDIRVGDGERILFSRQNIQITGTGNVVGAARDEVLEGSSVSGGGDPGLSDKIFSGKNSVAFIFVGAVFGLGLLLLLEKFVRKK